MWAGTLVFGLVQIPVRLGPATRPRELAFRQVHAEDGGRITFRRTCTTCGADVPYAEVAKAYQPPGGDLVPLTDDDLAALPLEAARRIEIRCFVPAGRIDPLLVSRSYFLAAGDHAGPGPDDAADRAYQLFRTALAASGRVAVATITLRQRESRAAIWARGPALVLQTLLTPDELVTPDELANPNGSLQPAAQPNSDPGPGSDLSLAADLITAMTGEFDPAGHHDRYRDQLEDLIHHKTTADPASPTDPISPENLTHPASPASPVSHSDQTDVTDLTDLLRASLATPR
jgi:DNA end-binding protein Ku